MKHSKRCLLFVFLLASIFTPAVAQNAKPDPKEHEEKVKDIVAFLEYVLNTLGSSTTSARDKDVLITESYTKIFRDAKVQVEDDLDDKRNVVTNKDVQAYLKDVDFFFDDVKFELNINKILGQVNANGKLFYKITLSRNLKGTTVGGKAVNSTIPRYIEVNFNPEDQDLKIVSIYTHEFDESEALTNWWKGLSYEWQAIFKRNLNIGTDSVTIDDIRNMASIEGLDLSANQYIQDIEPLGQLVSLHRLDISNTQVDDLSPIRNLTELVDLDISGTPVQDLSPMRYASKLARFNIARSYVNDISVMEKLTALEYLDLSDTNVPNFEPLQNLTALQHLALESTLLADLSPLQSLVNLKELNVSGTSVAWLNPLEKLALLETVNLDSTLITDIVALSSLKNLKIVSINHTAVPNLRPLLELSDLEKVYCDHSQITRSLADSFMSAKPGALVIYDTEDLQSWWQNTPAGWQQTLSAAAGVGLDPTKEELASITNLDSIVIAGNAQLRDLEPLRRLQKLQYIDVSKTTIKDLEPLDEHREIRYIDVSNTPVGDLSIITLFPKVVTVKADDSEVQSIVALSAKTSLQQLYVDGIGLDDAEVREFMTKNPSCLVVYKTDTLTRWWESLPVGWQDVFDTQIRMQNPQTREDLHQLVELTQITFSDARIDDLSVLKEFIRLQKLNFSGTAIQDLTPLESLGTLQSVHATLSPIQELYPLAALADLKELDISNTPVDDLGPVSQLQNLSLLNCSGTQVSRLDPLAELPSLETLDCSNTPAKKLDPVEGLGLRTLKCFNTRISSKRVDSFKAANPDCNVIYY